MITAKEAREKVEKLETERGEREKKIAEQKILKAVERAQCCCWLGICIANSTKQYLESLGYKVEFQDDQMDGPDTKVSW